MEGTGIIGAIALIIIFLFVCMFVFIIKLILDLRIYRHNQKEERPSSQKEEKVMYLIEKPKNRQKHEKEYTMVSPKKIYTIDEK